jgi:hypothetical protein
MGNNIDIDTLIKALEAITEKLTGFVDTTQVTDDELRKRNENLSKSVAKEAGYARAQDGTLTKLQDQSLQRIELEKKLNKEIDAQFGAGKALAAKRDALYKDQLKSMNYVIDANNQLIKTSTQLGFLQRQQIGSLKRSEEATSNLHKAQDDLVSNIKRGTGDLGKGMGRFAVDLAKGNTSFATLNPLIDIVANSMAALAKAIPFVGEGVAAGIKAAAEASKFVIDLMDKNLKAFQELSNSGALVSDGMTGVGRQLIASGMTLEGFKKIVKENGQTFASFGGTVGKGAGIFADGVGMLTKKNGALSQAGLGLRALGLTADDIGENAAAFLEQEIRLGRGRQMTDKQLAEGTVRYTKELDLLQKVTGLSRQEIQKQQDALMSDSRYRATREEMLANGQEAGAKALDKLTMLFNDPTMKQGIKDLASGGVASEQSGKLVQVFGSSLQEGIEQLKESRPEDIPKVWDSLMKTMQEATGDYVDNFRGAAKYLDPEIMGNFATYQDIANGKYRGSMEEAAKIQADQTEKTDKLTKSTVSAQQSMEALSLKMFELGNDMLPYASDAVAKFADSLNELADFIKNKFGITPTGPLAEDKARAAAREASDKRKEAIRTHGRDSEEAKVAREKEARAKENVVTAQTQAEQDRRNKAPSGPGTVAPSMAEQRRARQAAEKGATGTRSMAPIGEPPKPGPGVKVASLSPFLPATQGSARKADYAMESANSPAPAVKAVDVMKLIKFQGDKLGTKSHFDALSPTARDKFTEMIAAYNKPVQVNSAMRDPKEQQKLWDAATPDPNNPNKRLNAYGNPVAPPGSSRHESGKALDLNTSDVEALDAGGFLKTFGFKRLADDPPHIEMARLGGVFNGPDSGYPVMLHGTEAVLPSVQLEEVKSMMGSVSKTSLDSELPSITNNTSTNNDDTLNALRDLYDVMSDKLDNVIDKLASGNDIQDKLLRNSMV